MTSEGRELRAQRMAVGDLTVDAGTHQVTVDGREFHLPKLSFQLLLALARAAPDMLTTDQLIEIVWSGRVVSNETVTQRVKLLRQAIGDDAKAPKYIGVLRGEGYRLLVDVHPLPRAPAPEAVTRPMAARITRLALALLVVVGVGFGVWWATTNADDPAATRTAMQRLVVLPLVNRLDDTDMQWLVDGFTDELIAELNRVADLRVMGRSASFAFKARAATLAQVGRAIGVDHVLDGSVSRNGDSLRVATRLMSVADGAELWSASFECTPDDVVAVTQQIALGVTRSLQMVASVRGPSTTGTNNGRAHAHFLRGRALFWNHTPETTRQSIDQFLAALQLDPEFVRTWVDLGYAYGALSRELGQTDSALGDMQRASQRAMLLNPDDWEVQALSAWVQMSQHAFLDAERSMQRAMELRARGRNQR